MLKEVVVYSKKKTQQHIIDGFKKSSVSRFFSCGKNPRKRAKFFPFRSEYDQTPLLNKIRLCSHSETENAIFNMRLYQVDKNGKPGNYIYDKNIYGYSKVGKRIVEILTATEELLFSNQWEVDEFDPSCRRIIVKKKFRVLYKEINKDILITRVYPNKTDIKNKK